VAFGEINAFCNSHGMAYQSTTRPHSPQRAKSGEMRATMHRLSEAILEEVKESRRKECDQHQPIDPRTGRTLTPVSLDCYVAPISYHIVSYHSTHPPTLQ